MLIIAIEKSKDMLIIAVEKSKDMLIIAVEKSKDILIIAIEKSKDANHCSREKQRYANHCQFPVSVSAQDGIVALGKAHTRSAPSLSSLPKVALETVPIFAWLNADRSRPWRVECRPLPFSTPLSFRRSML